MSEVMLIAANVVAVVFLVVAILALIGLTMWGVN